MNNNSQFKLPRRVERIGVVETNSSSTHSLSICSDKSKLIHRGDSDFNLEIGEDNVLYLGKKFTNEVDFGWGWAKYNDCKTKLYYATGLVYCEAYIRCSPGVNYKKVTAFKTVLCNYLGVSDVIFEWDEEYLQGKSGIIDNPTVDHQSVDSSYTQIFESSDTLLDFIFSRKSWLYIGNDNSDEPYVDFYKESFIDEEDKSDAVFRVDFGNYFSQRFVDSPVVFIDSYLQDERRYDGINSVPKICGYLGILSYYGSALDNIYIDEKLKKVKMIFSSTDMSPKTIGPGEIVQDEAGNLFVLFISQKVSNFRPVDITDVLKDYEEFSDSKYKDIMGRDKVNIIELLGRFFKKDEDYFIFPITPIFKQFNIVGSI